jgi:quercetin dioxygenase-like cupin family protein
MRAKTIVAGSLAAVVLVGALVSSARAQDTKVPQEKDVKATAIMTSLGPFREAVSIPIVLSGQVIEIAPGGQTGRQRHNVPSFIYVLEGTLVTNSEGGRVGVAGVQYHTAGQAYSDPVGIWHNHSAAGSQPVKYLLLLISTPGANATEKAKADE